jgi:hypothetical protein
VEIDEIERDGFEDEIESAREENPRDDKSQDHIEDCLT